MFVHSKTHKNESKFFIIIFIFFFFPQAQKDSISQLDLAAEEFRNSLFPLTAQRKKSIASSRNLFLQVRPSFQPGANRE